MIPKYDAIAILRDHYDGRMQHAISQRFPAHPFPQLATPIGPTSKISTDPAAPEASKLNPAARQDDPFAASIGPSGSQNYKLYELIY